MNRHSIFVTFPTCCFDNLPHKQQQLKNLKLSVMVVLVDIQSKAQRLP